MKRLIPLVLVMFSFTTINAQTTRYFRFHLDVDSTIWQDTSFIAASSDAAIIDTVLADLAKPIAQRKMVTGVLAGGNAGYNRNASHWFLWHYVEDQWKLVEAAIELCDGRPYSDVDADTAYWIGNVGRFCPWHARVVEEISAPTVVNTESNHRSFYLYPNPAKDNLVINLPGCEMIHEVEIFDVVGTRIYSQSFNSRRVQLGLNSFKSGTYLIKLNGLYVQQLVKE